VPDPMIGASEEKNWEPLHTEKNDPVDVVDPEDIINPDDLPDGPPQDYPDDDAELDD
jgi:hypothetical protein